MSFFDVIIKQNNNLYKSSFNIKTIKEYVDLRPKMSSLESYEFLGSIANSLAILIEYDIPNYSVSRLFQYYIERLDIDEYTLENAIDKLIKYGFCSTSDYPYKQELINNNPPQDIYDKASLNKYKFDIIMIAKDLNSLLLSLNNNEPFIICIQIYEPIETINISLKLPESNVTTLGAIAVVVCGYDMNKQIFIVRFLNTYINIPFTYLLKEGLSSNAYIFVIRTFDIIIDNKELSNDNINIDNNDYPLSIDLRNNFMEIYDQGKIGSCTANALCSIFEYDANNFKGSRLFLYYNERLMINKTDEDSGAYLIDGINSLKTFGICEEKYWKYNIDNIFISPTKEAYTNAKNNYLIDSLNIKNNLNEIKKWLLRNEPIAIAIAIYSNFMEEGRNNHGIINMPKENDIYLGGHAVILCGYMDKDRRFILRNSWGHYWGDKGYFYLPYEYIIGDKNLCGNDLWIITKSKINQI